MTRHHDQQVTASLGAGLDAALVAIGEALGFGDHYGENLDALADCLTDLDEATTLVLTGWEHLAWADPTGWSRLRTVLDARATNRLEGIQGTVELPAFRIVAGTDQRAPRAL